jgi:alkylhydroperoxidase/carboxymuconolactone decarboxylase family protein YurZ
MDKMNKTPVVPSLDLLRAMDSGIAESFEAFRKKIVAFGPLDAKQRELCLLAGYAAAGNEQGFHVHIHKARVAGLTLKEVQQAVLLMLGANIGIGPAVKCLQWAQEEYAGAAD